MGETWRVTEKATGVKKHVAKRPLGRESQPCFLFFFSSLVFLLFDE